MQTLLLALTFAAAIGSGIVGGIFYAFSTFVMAAFARLPPEQGTAAMNAVNVTVLTPSFLGVFMGTALLGVLTTVFGLLAWNTSGMLLVAAGLLYVVGCFGVTMVFNVPLNNRLALGKAAEWAGYQAAWIFWNHFRTAASILACTLYVSALATAP